MYIRPFLLFYLQVSYCQGMSDIASPILAVMDNEAHAFICFCGIMKRLEGNFHPDGQLMSVKFQHLKLLLQYSDPEFYTYLVSKGADDLFFCYRWLLLELKREFAFDDALRMLEVTWSSLPPDPPETEVELLGLPLEADESQTHDSSCPNSENEKLEKEQTDQRRRHMLRPSQEEADGGRSLSLEAERKEEKPSGGEDKGVHSGDCAVKTEGPAPAPPFEKQPSFGEFKYYSAQNEDSFEANENESSDPTLSSVKFQSTHSLSLTARQSTEDSEDDPGERQPLISMNDQLSSPQAEEKNSSNGQTVSPLPPTLLNWKNGSQFSATSPSISSWRAVCPDVPGSKSSSSSFTVGGAISPDKAVGKFGSSAAVSNGTGVHSPSTPTGKSALSSPSLGNNRSLLSSPVLSFAKSPSLPKPFSSNLSSPCKLSGTGANTPTTGKPDTSGIKPCSLPPPQEFGKGNPFMLFLCLSILLEHRDHIIKNSLDYNELAMHFDRLVRKHNLGRILQRAKSLFADYLQSEVWDSEEGDEVSLDSPTTAASSPQTLPKTSFSNLQSTMASSPNSTYNLASTIPSPTTPNGLSPSSS